MESCTFKGFIPSEELKLKAERALDRIIERAPSDASITAAVELDGDLYHCSIEIGSSSGPFAIETSHRLAAIAIDKAEINILRKLDRWRGARFQQSMEAPHQESMRVAT